MYKIFYILLLVPLAAFAGTGTNAGTNEQLKQAEYSYNQTKIQMNRVYRQMRHTMPATEIQGFDVVQGKWIAYRDASCHYYGRNIASQMECLENMNTRRIKEMQEILNNYK